MVAEFAPKLMDLEKKLTGIQIQSITSDFENIQRKLRSQFVALKDEKGNVVNICPKCGDTLKVKTTMYYGKIFGCPNYPKCRHLIKWSDCRPETFNALQINRDTGK